MRMRRKKNRDVRFERNIDIAVTEPFSMKGRWHEFFGNNNPIHLEIGCGKGKFISETALKNPEINYVAVEVCLDVIIIAMEKVKAAGASNVRFINFDAKDICEVFAENEIDRIYLNFSDPWKKARQAKRRLTYRDFLDKYAVVLSEAGSVHFKTDNRPLFDFSLEEFAYVEAQVSELSFDLHNSVYEKDNVHTEYEDNFSAKGFPINRCVVKLKKNRIKKED